MSLRVFSDGPRITEKVCNPLGHLFPSRGITGNNVKVRLTVYNFHGLLPLGRSLLIYGVERVRCLFVVIFLPR